MLLVVLYWFYGFPPSCRCAPWHRVDRTLQVWPRRRSGRLALRSHRHRTRWTRARGDAYYGHAAAELNQHTLRRFMSRGRPLRCAKAHLCAYPLTSLRYMSSFSLPDLTLTRGNCGPSPKGRGPPRGPLQCLGRTRPPRTAWSSLRRPRERAEPLQLLGQGRREAAGERCDAKPRLPPKEKKQMSKTSTLAASTQRGTAVQGLWSYGTREPPTSSTVNISRPYITICVGPRKGEVSRGQVEQARSAAPVRRAGPCVHSARSPWWPPGPQGQQQRRGRPGEVHRRLIGPHPNTTLRARSILRAWSTAPSSPMSSSKRSPRLCLGRFEASLRSPPSRAPRAAPRTPSPSPFTGTSGPASSTSPAPAPWPMRPTQWPAPVPCASLSESSTRWTASARRSDRARCVCSLGPHFGRPFYRAIRFSAPPAGSGGTRRTSCPSRRSAGLASPAGWRKALTKPAAISPNSLRIPESRRRVVGFAGPHHHALATQRKNENTQPETLTQPKSYPPDRIYPLNSRVQWNPSNLISTSGLDF